MKANYRQWQLYVAGALLAIGLTLIYLFTGGIRFMINDAIGTELQARYEQTPPEGWPAAKWKALWVTGGWGWVFFLTVSAIPGIVLSSIGVVV